MHTVICKCKQMLMHTICKSTLKMEQLSEHGAFHEKQVHQLKPRLNNIPMWKNTKAWEQVSPASWRNLKKLLWHDGFLLSLFFILFYLKHKCLLTFWHFFVGCQPSGNPTLELLLCDWQGDDTTSIKEGARILYPSVHAKQWHQQAGAVICLNLAQTVQLSSFFLLYFLVLEIVFYELIKFVNL